MREIEPPFEIEYQGNQVTVTEAEIDDRRVFHIQLAGQRKRLIVTVAEDRQQVKFWTSLPQGRQQEAEEVGKLIATYIRSKAK
jgi:hypothetical protein